jgi:hypothetical protein
MNTRKKGELTPKEQKTTTAFKMMSAENKNLRESLKKAQDELETMRDKYHEADKGSAIQRQKNQTLALHEFLKYLLSVVLGGVGISLVTSGNILYGGFALLISIILYVIIVWFDRK